MFAKMNVAVATIVKNGDRFMMVEEQTEDGIKLNQPSCKLATGQSPVDAATGTIGGNVNGFVGAYQVALKSSGAAFMRLCFAATTESVSIVENTVWLTYGEIMARKSEHRNTLVAQCIDDFNANVYPIDVVKAFTM